MTFKGMLRILINDYRKQHVSSFLLIFEKKTVYKSETRITGVFFVSFRTKKMFSLVQELIKTQRELRQVKEELLAVNYS